MAANQRISRIIRTVASAVFPLFAYAVVAIFLYGLFYAIAPEEPGDAVPLGYKIGFWLTFTAHFGLLLVAAFAAARWMRTPHWPAIVSACVAFALLALPLLFVLSLSAQCSSSIIYPFELEPSGC